MTTDTPFLIVGLGNPGLQFRNNRHNIGFLVIDFLVAGISEEISRLEHQTIIAEGVLEDRKVYLAKPQTFMNVSGPSVARLVESYDVSPAKLLIISDDIDLPLGQLRLRESGGTGGHKGLRSIQERLGTQDIPRLRIGIGRPPGRTEPADYVLEDFSESERTEVEITIRLASDCVRCFLREGIQPAMTRYNRNIET
jgi:PTH1 family peptidyl-tRNA hydrolase